MAHTYLDFVYGSLEKDAQMNSQPCCSKILSQDLKKTMKLSLGKNHHQTNTKLLSYYSLISLFLSLMVYLFHIFPPLNTEES